VSVVVLGYAESPLSGPSRRSPGAGRCPTAPGPSPPAAGLPQPHQPGRGSRRRLVGFN